MDDRLNDLNEKPLVSVLMPTYNVAQYIECAVKSIIHQTYSNFELIIVDDCSSDGTYEILKQLAKEDQRVILAQNEKNSKICITLNKAWALSKGNFIIRMDGDDISEPERIEVLLTYLNGHPDIDLVGSQVISIREDGEVLSYKEYLRTPDFIHRGNKIAPCVSHIWMARRRVYEKLDGYRNVPFVEDYDFLLRGEKEGFRYANVEEYLYKVRIRSGNTGSTNGLKQRKANRFLRSQYRLSAQSEASIEKAYQKAIRSSSFEQTMYNKAYRHLDIAVQSRRKPWKLVYHVLMGMLESHHIFRYIVEAVKMRTLLYVENKNLPRLVLTNKLTSS